MASNRVEIQFDIDTGKATGNVRDLKSEYRKLLADLGKTGPEIAAFMRLADSAARGQVEMAGLDEETQQLLATYQELAKVADARETLGLIPHEKITEEINKARQAYDDLKDSGLLSSEELAEAALRMEQEIARLNGETGDWVEALGEVKLSLAAIAAGSAGLVAAAGQAIEFESAMASVRKVTELTDQQFGELTEQIKQMASEVPIGIDALAGMAAQAGQLGIAGEDIGKFTLLAAKMATAFDIGAEQAGDAIATLKNVFQLPLADVEALGDAINTLGNNTAAREADVVDVLTRIGGSARQFGLAADQAAALSAALISLGKPPEVAATAINALLSKLQTANVGTNDFKAALADLGIGAEQLAKDISDKPQQALSGFLSTLQKLDNQSRAEIITRLFGAEYQDDISVLIGSIQEYDKALGLVTNKTAAAGALEKEYQQKLQTTDAQLALLSNSVEVLAVNLGTVFLPAINAVAGGLKSATTAIAEFVQAYPLISGAASVIATLAAGIAGLKVAFAGLGLAAASAGTTARAALALLRTEITLTTLAAHKLNLAFSVLAAGIIGWEIGSWARENFGWVERAGIAMAGGLHSSFEKIRYTWETVSLSMEKVGISLAGGMESAFEKMRFAWESFKAVFTSDTLAEAAERHLQRAKTLSEGYAEQFADVVSREEASRKRHATAAKALEDGYADLFAASLKAEEQSVKGNEAAGESAKQAAEELAAAAALIPVPMAAAQAGVAKTAETFTQLRLEGITTGAALKTTFDALDLTTPAGLTEAVDTTVKLAGEAGTTAEVLRTDLGGALESLSGAELQRFQAGMQAAFAQGRISAEDLAVVMSSIGERAAQAVGLSLRELETGINDSEQAALEMFTAFTASGKRSAEDVTRYITALHGQIKSPEAVTALKALVDGWEKTTAGSVTKVRESIKALAEATAGTTENFLAGLEKRLEQVKNAADLSAARDELRQLGTDGKLSGDQVSKGLDLVNDRATELNKSDPGKGVRDIKDGADAAAPKLSALATQLEQFNARVAASNAELEQFKERGRGLATSIAGIINGATESMWGLSEAAGRAFETLQFQRQFPTDEVARLGQELQKASEDVTHFSTASRLLGHSFGSSFADIYGNAARVREEFYRQRLEVEQLMQTIERAGVPTHLLSQDVETLRQRFGMLDDADLSPLISSIQRAKNEVESLNSSLMSTISGLKQELASLRGDQVEIEALRNQQQRLELEERLQQARSYGDKAAIAHAQEALQLQEQAYALRQKAAQQQAEETRQRQIEQRRREAEQQQTEEARLRERQEEQARRDRVEPAQTKPASKPTEPAKQRIVLEAPSGRSVDVDINAGQTNQLLDLLAEYGLRTR